MSRPSVRPAASGDAPVLARLRYEFREAIGATAESLADFERRCIPWMRGRLAGDSWRAWVAEEDGAIVGTVWLQVIEKLPNPVAEREWHGYVSSLYVHPGRRGHGLGGELLQRCVLECERRQVDVVILWPTPASRALYTRHGFAAADDLLARRLGAPAPSGAR